MALLASLDAAGTLYERFCSVVTVSFCLMFNAWLKKKLSITGIIQQYYPIPKYFTKQATMCRKGACETWTERPVRF